MATTRAILLVGGLLAVGACGEDPFDGSALQPVTIWKVGGDAQTDTVRASLKQPLSVRVLRGGRPLQDFAVRWRLDYGGEMLLKTDGSGVASVAWTLGSRAGEKRASAWLEGIAGESVEFRATARPGQPAKLQVPDDAPVNDQVGALGAPLLFDYWTVVTDAYGNVLRGDFAVDWAVTAGGGSIEKVPAPDRSDPGQYARHTLGPAEGPNQVTVTAGALPGRPRAIFNARGVMGLVKVQHGGFDSDSVTVAVGTTVGWIWAPGYDADYGYDETPHDIVFADDAAPPVSSTTRNLGVHVRTFTAPGVYRYRCTIHSASFRSGHLGMVVVR